VRCSPAVLALLLCTSTSVAQEPDERTEREDALFGDSDDDTEARESELFGDDSEEPGLLQDGVDLIARLDEKDDDLQIGGQLYMRLDWYTKARGGVETFPLASPSLLDLYLDARPMDRLRAYVRGRVAHDFTTEEGSTNQLGQPRDKTRVMLDQLWLKFDIDRLVFFTVGQQPIRWGHGRFWNPTDFLNRQFKDPLAVFDERLGVALVKVHIPVESLGWNFYAIADLDEADSPDKVGAALRGEFVLGTMEIAASFAARKDSPYRLGLSLSTGFWLIDAWAEVAALYDVRIPRWGGPMLWDATASADVSNTWWPRASAGFEISIPLADEDTLYLGVEYSFNSLGYDDATLYPLLALRGALVPFHTGKHYAALYAVLPAPGRWDDVTFSLSQLANISDQSFILRFDTRMRVLTYLDLNVYGAVHYGHVGEFNYSASIPGLPDLAPPMLDLGIGLRLRL